MSRPSSCHVYATRIILAVSEGHDIREIARALGFRPLRVFRWLKTHPGFRDAVSSARLLAQKERAARLAEILNTPEEIPNLNRSAKP